MKKTVEQRFWEKVEKTNDCWIWRAATWGQGYGSFGLCRDGHWMISAHRMSYLLCVGEIPKGMQVLHRCDNRLCVRPDHLFLGTNVDNIADKVKKGRQSRLKGELHPMAKLTLEQVDAIRSDKRIGRIVGKEYGICAVHVNKIKRGEAWR